MAFNYLPYDGTKNIKVGKGRVHFAQYDNQGVLGDYKLLGNCPGFTINIETEQLDHFSSLRNIREKDKSIITQINRSGSITCDEISPTVLSYFLQGNIQNIASASATITNELHENVEPGVMIQLGYSITKPLGNKNIDPLSLVVTDVAGTTTYALGTDYIITSAELGLISIPLTTTITGNIHVDYDIDASTSEVIASGVNPLNVAILFIADDAGALDVDKVHVFMPYVTVRPEGDLGLISEEFNTVTLNIEPLPYLGQAAIYTTKLPVI